MKSDYAKGVTAGNGLAKRKPFLRHRYYTTEHERRDAVRTLEDKYSALIGDLVCPDTGEPAYMRMSWYRDGINDGLRYGHGVRFLVVRFSGSGHYNISTLAEETVYDNPALAWKRSWELDPQGHNYKSIDALYVNGACERFGLNEVYGI